jgi:beta-phosphoglucomutase-like phosphatase (HAD superfamily)
VIDCATKFITTTTTTTTTMTGIHQIKRFLYAILPAAALLHVATCFNVVGPMTSLCLRHNCPSLAPTTSHYDRRYQLSFPIWSSSSPVQQEDDVDDDGGNSNSNSNSNNNGADGLYEFLTKRTGEQAGEVERRRKRNRIREWMTSSSSNNNNSNANKRGGGGSNMVQPIRMEDGSVMKEDDNVQVQPTTPTKPKFDKLFAGMPTLDEILTRAGDEEGTQTTATATPTGSSSNGSVEESLAKRKKNRPKELDNDAWFEEERQQLIQEYVGILEEMQAQLAEQRQKDPGGVPPNSDRIIESVVFQERNRIIASVKIARSKERLQAYEIERMSDLEASRNVDQVSDEIANRILQEAADDWKRREALQSKVDDFDRYAQEANIRATTSESSASSPLPQPGRNLDEWALERLEGMLETSKEKSDDVTDILEESIDDLRERMEKESKRGSIQPQTMKEWQMIRSITTRLGKENPTAPYNTVANEERISNQLNSWREYIGKEEDIRNRSGLSVGTRMPFEWQKPGRDPLEDPIPVAAVNTQAKTRREIRRDVNIQAVKAMEELVLKSDIKRSESLRRQLDALKAELESRDYNDIEEELVAEEQNVEPVNLSDLFSRKEEPEKVTSSGFTEDEMRGIDQMLSKTPSAASSEGFYTPPIPEPLDNDEPPEKPNTPFFSDDATTAERPKSPFYSDESANVVKGDDIVNSKLGSGEEQKLRAMYRRAGATTKEEQDAIRAEYEGFQSFEKARREESGLSDGDDSLLVEKANLKYDLSEVMTSDGDFDAEKILATLGPRPTRRKKTKGDNLQSGINPAEVTDSLYRTIEAVGGGTTKDDPVARKQERSQFEEYLLKEQELRKSLDNPQDDVDPTGSAASVPIDDPDYVEDVLDSIGPRPTFKRKVKQEPSEVSEVGSADAGPKDSPVDSGNAGILPSWLKKEREASKSKGDDSVGLLGGNMDEVFDDDKYEHNLRQLHEYKQRRSGKSQQMGVDLTDVLGKRGSDDYADYTYDDNSFRGRRAIDWAAASFEARKRSLLDYTELTTMELNSLMDHRDSVYTTGASQYQPRINKPFKEFGAVFRLEGVLVDLTGLHSEVWKKVATKYEFTEPMLGDFRRAAVTRPEIAIRDIFYWTNDIQLANKVLSSFREIFRQMFDEWALEKGIVADKKPTVESKGAMALGAEIVSPVPAEQPSTPATTMTEESRMAQIKERWSMVAAQRGYAAPTNEQVAQCSFLSPDIAVRNVLRWSTDPVEIDSIVKALSGLQSSSSSQTKKEQVGTAGSGASSPAPLDQGAVLELQYKAWVRVATDNNLNAPEPEEVLVASVLNDPEAVVIHGYGWTSESDRASELAKSFRDYFAALLKEVQNYDSSNTVAAPMTSARADTEVKTNEKVTQTGPSEEEILKMQIEAWEKAAKAHQFSPPSPDQIQLTINLSATDSVSRLLGWTYNFNGDQIKEISLTYGSALKEASEKYLKMYGIAVETVNVVKAVEVGKSNGITADMVYQAAFDAWTSLAWQAGKPLPDQDQVQFAMSVGPEEAIVNGFEWTDDYTEAGIIAEKYREQLKGKRQEWKKNGYSISSKEESKVESDDEMPMVSVVSEVSGWITSLQEVEMGCGVASCLERDQMDILLKYAGLADLLPADKRVSLNNGYDRESQQMLGVALRIERRPDHCVIFDSSPYANSGAQEIDMRSVSLVGPYPRYELLSADTTAFSLDDLTALNIRRLFGERVYDQPMLDMKQLQPVTVRKTLTKFWDPDD